MKLLSSETLSPRRFLLYANTIHIIVLFVVVNVALAVLFLVKAQLSASGPKTTTTNKGALFDDTGAPIDNGRRTYYQKTWFDYSAYQAVADQVYVGSVLDDFTSLAKLGFFYQPWVQFSERPYDGKLLHVDT